MSFFKKLKAGLDQAVDTVTEPIKQKIVEPIKEKADQIAEPIKHCGKRALEETITSFAGAVLPIACFPTDRRRVRVPRPLPLLDFDVPQNIDRAFRGNPALMAVARVTAKNNRKTIMDGDILYFPRKGGYYHVAVYVGGRKIIHFTKKNGKFRICEDWLDEDQIQGRAVYIDLHEHKNSRRDIIRIAREFESGKKDIGDYNLIDNNCELFARICCGEYFISQTTIPGNLVGNGVDAITENPPFLLSCLWNGNFP
jgi:hypothetical protein